MLEIDVRHARGDFRLAVEVGIDGPTFGLFGPSGAGKTTLLLMIAGLIQPDDGVVKLDGEILFDASARVHVPAHRRRVGVVFQDARLFPHYSVAGNLLYGRKNVGHPAEQLGYDAVVDMLELRSLLDRRVAGLSGGERQRVALGRALIGSPRLLCLDEPLASLDQTRRRQILPFLRRVRDEAGIPMLYVTHALGELLQLTERLALMEQGRLVAVGRYRELALEGRLGGALDLLNVLEAKRAPEDVSGLAALVVRGSTGELHLRAARAIGAPGEVTAIAVRPVDIALATSQPADVSIQNAFPARVTRIARHGGDAMIELDAGTVLLASIGENMIEELALEPGRQVICLVKASAIGRA